MSKDLWLHFRSTVISSFRPDGPLAAVSRAGGVVERRFVPNELRRSLTHRSHRQFESRNGVEVQGVRELKLDAHVLHRDNNTFDPVPFRLLKNFFKHFRSTPDSMHPLILAAVRERPLFWQQNRASKPGSALNAVEELVLESSTHLVPARTTHVPSTFGAYKALDTHRKWDPNPCTSDC